MDTIGPRRTDRHSMLHFASQVVQGSKPGQYGVDRQTLQVKFMYVS